MSFLDAYENERRRVEEEGQGRVPQGAIPGLLGVALGGLGAGDAGGVGIASTPVGPPSMIRPGSSLASILASLKGIGGGIQDAARTVGGATEVTGTIPGSGEALGAMAGPPLNRLGVGPEPPQLPAAPGQSPAAPNAPTAVPGAPGVPPQQLSPAEAAAMAGQTPPVPALAGPQGPGTPLDLAKVATQPVAPTGGGGLPAAPGAAPQAPGAPPAAPGGQLPGALGDLLSNFGKFAKAHPLMLMAMGAGLAGKQNWGTGISAALGNAVPAAQMDIKTQQLNATRDFLRSRGVPDDLSIAMTGNPQMLSQMLPRLMGVKQMHWGVIGESALGKTYGWVDDVNMKAYDASGREIGSGGGGVGAGSIPNSPTTGQPMQGQELLAYLKQNHPIEAAGVEGLIAGDERAARNLQKLGPVARLVDPTFNEQRFNARLDTVKAFAPNGIEGKKISALNLGLGHIDRLLTNADKLGNFTLVPAINAPYNAVRGQIDPNFQRNVAQYRANMIGVSGELATVFRNVGMAEADIQAWKKSFNENSSPETIKAAAIEAMHMLNSRLDTLADNWNRGMGLSTNKPAPDLLSPEGRRVYEKLQRLEQGYSTPSTPAAGISRDDAIAEARRRGLIQ